MRRSGIYRIELGNGYFYIGSSVRLERRELDHCWSLRENKHINKKMQAVYNKYKVYNFAVIELCDEIVLLEREQFFLDTFFDDAKNVNLCPIAGRTTGYRHSAATLKKMSKAWETRSPVSAVTRSRISAANKGKTRSVEMCKNMGDAKRGRVVTLEQRQKISNTLTGRKLPPFSDVRRENMSVAAKAAWARRCADKYFSLWKQTIEEMDYGKKCS